MNKKMVLIACVVVIGIIGVEFFISHPKPKLQSQNPTIGIIIPLTHPAMDKIVSGFCTQLDTLLDKKCTYILRDAQGDQNVQQPAIIDEMKRKNVDIIVPIGTLCTQMTIQKAPATPVVALAATPSAIASENNLATGVHDEIDAKNYVYLIEKIIPKLSKIAIIATQNEKTVPEVQAFRNEALNRGIAVQVIYVQNASDMYLATHSIDTDAQAIHILKDHLVVSSIATINQVARDRKIPVIASDEGSVEGGAACALGIEEATTGKHGADLAFKILTGTNPGNIPVKTLDELVIFINKTGCKLQNASVQKLSEYAQSKKFKLISASKHSKD